MMEKRIKIITDSIVTNPRKRPRKDVMEDEDDEWVSSILLHQEKVKVQVNSGFRLLKQTKLSKFLNRVGVMVNMLTSSAVDRGFKPWLGQTKDYKIDICCFFAKHAALRRKTKD